ncbi:hypothetical protein Landi51_12876 [Colletotrichum acutatum]
MKNAITIFRIGKGIEMPHAPLRCDSWCDIMKDLALVRHVKMRSNGKTPVTVIATDCLRIRDTEKVANKNMHRLSAYMLSIEAYLSADIKPSNGILVQASICENVVGDMSSSSLSAESGDDLAPVHDGRRVGETDAGQPDPRDGFVIHAVLVGRQKPDEKIMSYESKISDSLNVFNDLPVLPTNATSFNDTRALVYHIIKYFSWSFQWFFFIMLAS